MEHGGAAGRAVDNRHTKGGRNAALVGVVGMSRARRSAVYATFLAPTVPRSGGRSFPPRESTQGETGANPGGSCLGAARPLPTVGGMTSPEGEAPT